MKFTVIASVLWFSLASPALAQDWKEWHKSNPTYTPAPNPSSPSAEFPPEPPPQAKKRDRIFLDQKFVVPARAEWNREIVTKVPKTVKIRVTSNTPKSIIVLTTKAWEKIVARDADDVDTEKDVFLFEDATEGTYERDVALPPGNYIIMMENQSSELQEFHLQCSSS